jgi:hypothetical protein
MKTSTICRSPAWAPLFFVVGCGGLAQNGDSGTPHDGGVGGGDLAIARTDLAGAATFQQVQAQAFSSCSCHVGGGAPVGPRAAPFGGLDLSPGQAYAQLVHVPAQIAPQKLRVVPGDPDHSFLYQKLTGQLASDGSEGAPMPELRAQWAHGPTPARLPEATLALVRSWIAAGAPND